MGFCSVEEKVEYRLSLVSSVLACFSLLACCENVFLMRSELFLSIFFGSRRGGALGSIPGLSVWLLMPHTHVLAHTIRMILASRPRRMLWSLNAWCCGIFAPPIALSAMCICVYGLVTINILLDEWDRTATAESQLLVPSNAAALRDQDQVTLLTQPSDWWRSKFSTVVAISPKFTVASKAFYRF